MGAKFSEDIIPISDLKVNPRRVVAQVSETHRPVLLTSRGRGVAVVQGLKDYEAGVVERAFMQAVVAGLMDVDEGRTVPLSAVKKRLGIS